MAKGISILCNILNFDNLTEENIYVLESPILSNSQFSKFIKYFGGNYKIFDCTFSKKESLENALTNLKNEAEKSVREGINQIILTDKDISKEKLPMPMLLCIGVINSHLINLGLRGYVSINVQTGDAFDTHSFATLIGVGATTVNPYLAFDSIHQRYSKMLFGKLSFEECISRYIKSKFTKNYTGSK